MLSGLSIPWGSGDGLKTFKILIQDKSRPESFARTTARRVVHQSLVRSNLTQCCMLSSTRRCLSCLDKRVQKVSDGLKTLKTRIYSKCTLDRRLLQNQWQGEQQHQCNLSVLSANAGSSMLRCLGCLFQEGMGGK